jgi:hypothetical protein
MFAAHQFNNIDALFELLQLALNWEVFCHYYLLLCERCELNKNDEVATFQWAETTGVMSAKVQVEQLNFAFASYFSFETSRLLIQNNFDTNLMLSRASSHLAELSRILFVKIGEKLHISCWGYSLHDISQDIPLEWIIENFDVYVCTAKWLESMDTLVVKIGWTV